MAITDIQISEELETNAPSIKYTGNEGPKSPQEEQQMMAGMMDLISLDFEMQHGYDISLASPEMREGFIEQWKQNNFYDDFSRGPVLPSPEDPVNPFQPKPQGPVLPDRQMAAYGGIMGMDGRRKYGIGSSLKKFVRKVIPNEVAEVAVKAAPFVAPFNPAVAAAMAGIGGFDQTGRIGSSLKSAALNYGLGQASRYIGGAGFQDPSLSNFGLSGFSMPTGTETGLGKFFAPKPEVTGATGVDKRLFTQGESIFGKGDALGGEMLTGGDVASKIGTKAAEETAKKTLPGKIMNAINKAGLDTKAMLAILGISGAAGLYTAATQKDETLSGLDRGKKMNIEGIRAEVIEAFKDPTGEKLAAIRTKYPFLGTATSKDIANMAYGGRINRAEGGLMNLGGLEKDYRAEGGFVPIGREEKADDVPARLSVNEFVFTADAVRNAGGGDVDRGAEIMENMMKHLEAGGQVSEESQGLAGARDMFAVSERLSEVV